MTISKAWYWNDAAMRSASIRPYWALPGIIVLNRVGRTSAADLQLAILDALERDVPHPNAVRLALEHRREQRGDAPQVAVVLPAHVQARDAPVQPHALETYDQLEGASRRLSSTHCAPAPKRCICTVWCRRGEGIL